ncbi:cytoskeleton-associated protein 2-like isoform X1 [Hippoglossus hippoglossus]|uniref:cytoskeleton-associated protein 2-like isoform X1 n=2 Tax=Hippoglossus hippoglossus TaxID=8267 RepID=UPI00148C8066|nr:cytoskeleton-associated protein 2-like isoform X1 [Hippoglossus hippoglossus]
MEEGETASLLSRKDLRKQKLMEYLAAKGRMKLPNPKPYLRVDCQVKKSVMAAAKVVDGKENKASVDTCKYVVKKVPAVAAQATTHPSRRPFGVTYKVNVKGSILTAQQNAKCQSSTSGSGRDRNPGLIPTITSMSAKFRLNAAINVKRQPATGMHSSGRGSSSSASHSKLDSGSNASSVPMKTISARMSLCPLVKTRTGLITAATQPRKSLSSHASATPANATTTTVSVADKVRSSTYASGPQKSVTFLKKTLTATALNNHVNKKTTVSSATITGCKIPSQDKSNAKPLLDKQTLSSRRGQLSSELKSLPTFKSKAAPVQPVRREGTTKTDKSAGKPADRLTQQKSDAGGARNGQTCKVSTQTSSGPASRSSFRADKGVRRGDVVELGGKTKTSKETQSKKGHSSSNAPPPQAGINQTGAPVMSRRASQPATSIRRTGLTTGTKTPKLSVRVLPQTEVKKLTAAQEERMRKLQEWRQTKGISYKRPPMPVKPQVRRTVAVPQPFWTAMKEEDDANSLICAVDRSLADCIKLLREGCPPDHVKEVLSRLPTVSQKFAKYWICQVRLMEQEGNLDVLPVFEEAVRVVLEPIDELRAVVFEILKKNDEIQASEPKQDQLPSAESSPESSDNPMMTPKPVRVLISGEKGNSSVVKYKITATPGGPPSQKREPARVNGQEVRFFTPVRRSVRIQRASLRYPAGLQDHDLCVASYNDLISEEDKDTSGEQEDGGTSPSVNDAPMFIYRQNEALKDKVLVQLVCDEGV